MSEELIQQLDKVTKNNIAIETDLRDNLKVSPQPLVLFNLRLNMLVTEVFGDAEDDRILFEIEYQEHIGQILQAIRQQVLEERGKAKLLLPENVTLPPGLKL